MKTINNKGASAVEFAIVLPILVILVFGILEFGLYIYDKSVITNASREGARYGVLYRRDPVTDTYAPYTPAEISTYVESIVSGKLITLNGTATASVGPVTCAGDELTVTVTYPFSFLVMPSFVTTPGPITATTVMRMENGCS